MKQSGLHNDYLTSYLRDQITRLFGILGYIEDSENYDSEFIIESLKKTEQNLHNIRKFLQN